jgi:aminopeptidase N
VSVWKSLLGGGFALVALVIASQAGSLGPATPMTHPEEAKVQDPLLDLPAMEARRYVGTLSNWPSAETDPSADVQHYDLDLDFNLATGGISGTATLTVVWGNQSGNSLILDLVDHTVGAVRGGTGGPLSFSQTVGQLDINITPPPSVGDTVTVEIDYGGIPSRSFTVGVNAAYTFTEPNGSRYWFPCRDVPWDKATLTLHGRVPSSKKLVSNGVLESVDMIGGDKVYHWREDHALATYLIAVAISDYAELHEPSPVTPLTWFVYPPDTALARVSFQNVDDMMTFYDAALVPYPFDKYAMCEANFGGGMEHQTATLMAEGLVTGGLEYEWITAHELAHQWFGDLVTLRDWRHIWLNESFATFYDAVWHESCYGSAKFDQRMQIFEDEVEWWENNRTDHPVVDPPTNALFSSLVYYKGAWVLRMLRDLMGKSVFDTAITNYLNTHAFGNASTADLQAVIEAEYGAPLDWFFDQWIIQGTGRPELSYVGRFDEFQSGWKVQLDILQTQSSPTVFRFPLEVKITTTSGEITMSDWVDTEHEVLIFDVPAEPLTVELDPDNKLLGTAAPGAQTAITDPGLPVPLLRAWPNPFGRSLRIEVAGGMERVEIFDVRGRRVRSFEGAEGSLVWDGRDASGRAIAPGIYYVRAAGAREAFKVVKLSSVR